MPQNYSGNLDCDQAACTELQKCYGGTKEVTRCLDAQNRDFARHANADGLTCIFLPVFDEWMTEATQHSMDQSPSPPPPSRRRQCPAVYGRNFVLGCMWSYQRVHR